MARRDPSPGAGSAPQVQPQNPVGRGWRERASERQVSPLAGLRTLIVMKRAAGHLKSAHAPLSRIPLTTGFQTWASTGARFEGGLKINRGMRNGGKKIKIKNPGFPPLQVSPCTVLLAAMPGLLLWCRASHFNHFLSLLKEKSSEGRGDAFHLFTSLQSNLQSLSCASHGKPSARRPAQDFTASCSTRTQGAAPARMRGPLPDGSTCASGSPRHAVQFLARIHSFKLLI